MDSFLLVSIIIDNYNYGRFLKESIDSALYQTYSKIEVIVVDDGSTDNSRDIIAQYGNRIISVLKENGGQASAFNTGFAASSGEIVIFLDADDILDSTFVATAQKLFVSDDIVKVHSPVWEVDEFCRKTGRIIPETELPEGNCRQLLIKFGPDAYINAPIHGNAFARNFLEKIFPIPEEFRISADIYPVTLASIFGTIKTISEPYSFYRIHGKNNFASQVAATKNKINLSFYDLRCFYLNKYLRETGDDINPEVWKKNHLWYKWMHLLDLAANDVMHLIPTKETFIFVDEDQLADKWGGAGFVENRQAMPFLEKDGEYWGPPPDDETAIREFERLRQSGANFIVFAWTAFWWLEHYQEFYKYLRTNYRCVLDNERLVVFKCDVNASIEGIRVR
jgi:glycosyltransferase involved in cell wall biosynthesis